MNFQHGQYSKNTRNQDNVHRESMAKKGKYKHLTPGDPEFDQVAAEILASVNAGKNQKQEGQEDMPKSTRECKRCGKIRLIVGRGLCSGCYGHEKKYGTLDDNFPMLETGRPAKKTNSSSRNRRGNS